MIDAGGTTMPLRETLDEAGMKINKWLNDNEVVLECKTTGKKEVWMANDGHASTGIVIDGTDFEFVDSIYR